MKVIYAAVGKVREPYLRNGINDYTGRISRYLPFEMIELPEARQPAGEQQAAMESRAILAQVAGKDLVVLLDENGEQLSSVEFAGFIRKKMNEGTRKMLFVSGGAFGFPPAVHSAAHLKLSLSRMTFPHRLVRLIFLEQLYRALTIIRGEPYHHE